ncbi:hypothetical protein J2Z48_002952 [Croceifilum oryzae]|uniref:Uncharacterized protein n=1 Tax=Croceifilum oryzae TaxID=1553429 RepID=A0AAJ1WTT3_9BACL|nr:hypothetical protein [Croceifilum oryzae]MDQ0418748.1 hypothetical protein [Croceifilum oryzae]
MTHKCKKCGLSEYEHWIVGWEIRKRTKFGDEVCKYCEFKEGYPLLTNHEKDLIEHIIRGWIVNQIYSVLTRGKGYGVPIVDDQTCKKMLDETINPLLKLIPHTKESLVDEAVDMIGEDGEMLRKKFQY